MTVIVIFLRSFRIRYNLEYKAACEIWTLLGGDEYTDVLKDGSSGATVDDRSSNSFGNADYLSNRYTTELGHMTKPDDMDGAEDDDDDDDADDDDADDADGGEQG